MVSERHANSYLTLLWGQNKTSFDNIPCTIHVLTAYSYQPLHHNMIICLKHNQAKVLIGTVAMLLLHPSETATLLGSFSRPPDLGKGASSVDLMMACPKGITR